MLKVVPALFLSVFPCLALANEPGSSSSGTSNISVTIPYSLRVEPVSVPQRLYHGASAPAGAYRIEVRSLRNEVLSERLISAPGSVHRSELPAEGIVILMPE